MPKLTKIYTRTGDAGFTTLGGGQKITKNAPRVIAYGTVDELNSLLGVAHASGLAPRLAELLPTIQNELFHLGSDLCFTEEDKLKYELPQIGAKHVLQLEKIIDELLDIVGPLQNFILPGGSIGAAHLHVARTVCRRAERDLVTLMQEESIGPFVLQYLNRLSDALFVMSRYENHIRQIPEPLWDSLA